MPKIGLCGEAPATMVEDRSSEGVLSVGNQDHEGQKFCSWELTNGGMMHSRNAVATKVRPTSRVKTLPRQIQHSI